MRIFKLLSVLALLFTVMTGSAMAADWKVSVDKDGIRVYTRPHPDSAFNEAKVETRVRASLSSIMAVMQNIPEFPLWMDSCEFTEQLAEIDESNGYAYMVISVPWPFQRRDVVYRYAAVQDPQSKVVSVTISDVKDYLPEQKNKVRLPRFSGSWQLVPAGDGYVDITYQIHFETGGMVPAAAANLVLVNAPLISIRNLLELLKEPRYRDAVLPQLIEP
ncbi:MAG: hypothetical protein KKI09_10490 [Spirochaetes bacterium]|nr:hypothetical protein [Spirochaetota bacterium]MBU0955845.1 hypothetical protein [Spirochaetota bacterium]